MREIQRWFRSTRKREMDFVWDLSRDVVKGKSRDQTDDGVGDPSRNRNHIQTCDLQKVSEPVNTATDLHNLLLVAQLVQSSRMDAPLTAKRCAGLHPSAERSSLPFRWMRLCASRNGIPRAGYNLLQLSVSAENSIHSWFRNLAASRHSRIEGLLT